MTFYNIIFAIVFIAAFQQLLTALLVFGPKEVLMAAIVCLLVFSDTIFTCDVIEGKGREYKTSMKLLDLAGFVLLSFAVLVLNPNSRTFQISDNTATWLHDLKKTQGLDDVLFWSILLIYWGALIWWNKEAKTYEKIPQGTKCWRFQIQNIQWWYWPLFLVVFIVTLFQYIIPSLQSNLLGAFINLIVLVLLVLYFFGYKRRLVQCMQKL